MTITVRKRTLILVAATLILLIVVARLCAAQRAREAAAQVTPTPSPTATPVPWWHSEPRGRGAEEQGSQGAATPTPPLPDTPAPVHQMYTVQLGDSLSGIANQYGTTVQELVELNKQRYPSLETDPGMIRVGWELFVPGPQSRSP